MSAPVTVSVALGSATSLDVSFSIITYGDLCRPRPVRPASIATRTPHRRVSAGARVRIVRRPEAIQPMTRPESEASSGWRLPLPNWATRKFWLSGSGVFYRFAPERFFVDAWRAGLLLANFAWLRNRAGGRPISRLNARLTC